MLNASRKRVNFVWCPMLLALVITAWINAGPEGGEVHSLAFDGSALFAANTSNGIFRSVDGGENWSPIFNRGIVRRVIADSGSIYAATDHGLFRSDDHGAMWRLLRDDAITDVDARGNEIAISIGTQIAISHDGGASWNDVDPPVAQSTLATVYAIRIDSASLLIATGGVLYRGTSGDWQQLSPINVVTISFDGSDILAGGASGAWRCRGSTCTKFTNEAVLDLAAWRGQIYAETENGVRVIDGASVAGFPALAIPRTSN